MKKKIVSTVLVLLLSVLSSYLATHNIVSLSSTTPTVWVHPLKMGDLQVCETFEIDLRVTDAVDLKRFDISLVYDQEVLECLEAREGSMLEDQDFKEPEIDNTFGKVALYSSTDHGANGNGTLATIRFKCIATGYTNIEPVVKYTNMKTDPNTDYGSYTVWKIYKEIPINEPYYKLCTDIFDYDKMNLFTINASNVVLDLNEKTIHGGGGYAVNVEDSSNVTIKNGVIKGFQYGVYILNCSHVNVSDVEISDSKNVAIGIEDSSGLHICDNTISNNKLEGLSLRNCSFSEVSGNVLSRNRLYGITMHRGSKNNTIRNNTISNNYPGGINIDNSKQNTIFSNNFINNTTIEGETIIVQHVKSDKSENFWDDGYPSGGNYWDDHIHQDVHDEVSGEKRTIPGPDGIGDRQYKIDEESKDYDKYPLMNPYGSNLRVFEETWETSRKIGICAIAVYTNSSITDFNFNKTLRKISFNVSDSTFCKVIVEKDLLEGAFNCSIDNVPRALILNWDETHIFINITYSKGNHNVEIMGQYVRPPLMEFPDINGDNEITIRDLFPIARNFGAKCLTCPQKPQD